VTGGIGGLISFGCQDWMYCYHGHVEETLGVPGVSRPLGCPCTGTHIFGCCHNTLIGICAFNFLGPLEIPGNQRGDAKRV